MSAVADISATKRYRSEAETTPILQELEAKYDLLKHRVDGWSAWPLLRFSLSRSLQNLPLDTGAPSGLTRQQLWGRLFSDLRSLAWVRRAPLAVKTFSSLHVEREGGAKKDIFFDDLCREWGGYKIEAINSPRIYLDPAPYLVRRDISTTGLNVITDRLARRRPVSGFTSIAVTFAECIRKELGFEHYTVQAIEAAFTSFVWSKRVYRSLLSRVLPKCLLLADTGDFPITAAAKELGIKVVEFQHGFTHRYFPGNAWAPQMLRYKQSIPLPDRIFTFGRHWQLELGALGFWSDELKVVGSTRVDSYRGRPPASKDSVCSIVVTTQGTDTERLVAFLAEFVRQAKGRLKQKLYIKLHPSYATSAAQVTEAFAGEPEVAIVAGSELPTTFELLQRADLHLSIYSTCHYEALALGVPTAIIPLTGHENVVHLYHSGHAFMPATPQELVEIAAGCKERRQGSEAGEEYFAPDAAENIRRELGQLLEGGAK
jgi:hypothetical protein